MVTHGASPNVEDPDYSEGLKVTNEELKRQNAALKTRMEIMKQRVELTQKNTRLAEENAQIMAMYSQVQQPTYGMGVMPPGPSSYGYMDSQAWGMPYAKANGSNASNSTVREGSTYDGTGTYGYYGDAESTYGYHGGASSNRGKGSAEKSKGKGEGKGDFKGEGKGEAKGDAKGGSTIPRNTTSVKPGPLLKTNITPSATSASLASGTAEDMSFGYRWDGNNWVLLGTVGSGTDGVNTIDTTTGKTNGVEQVLEVHQQKGIALPSDIDSEERSRRKYQRLIGSALIGIFVFGILRLRLRSRQSP